MTINKLNSIVVRAIGAAAIFLISIAARADDNKAELMAPINAFAEAFNALRPDLPAGIFAADATVVDEFQPYLWRGDREIHDWYGRLVGTTPETREKQKALNAHYSVGQPTFVEVHADRAYVVVPGKLTYRVANEDHEQLGAAVFQEIRVDGKWLIAAHAWAITVPETHVSH